MNEVKIIPISNEYRDNYERIFGKKTKTAHASTVSPTPSRPTESAPRAVAYETAGKVTVLQNPFDGSWFGVVL